MKQTVLITFLILIGFTLCRAESNDVLIKGKVLGDLPAEILYTAPIRGICDWGITNATHTDSLGNFNIHFQTENPSFVIVLVKGSMAFETSPTIVAEPGETYELTIDLITKEKPFAIKCSNNTIHQFYNNLLQANPRTCLYNFSRETSDMSGIKSDLLSLKRDELSKLNNFLREGTISKEVFNLIKSDREVYYGTALSTIASMNTGEFMRQNSAVPDSISKFWEEAVALVPMSSKNILGTKNLYDFLDLYYWKRTYDSIPYSDFSKLRSEYREKGLEHTYKLELASQFFNDEVLEYYMARYVIAKSRRKGENEFVTIIDKFNETYADSPFSKYLEPIKKVISQKDH
ncbi:hypothetical protein [Sunxiuqinia elliptica]|uniref:Uncharacterized protein n=1 Tax=Sunxiuqinia elliptica TaxID=655355 RepID=A0A1I2JSP2_9BACT|nr:hypothetical protein [Sunxiuqinia elliptica]SFF55751.1 hypothetical protein SAMN05216283_10964 [Sunxiuqinia elliptica]